MKRVRTYELEPVNPAQTKPWRLEIVICEDRTLFDLYWDDKTLPTHTFIATADEWKEITK